MAFTQPVDIANRALQHCGVTGITAFTDQSRQAKETLACYDALRLSELRRNLWRFATRRARVRSLTATTKLYSANAWASGTTYTVGQISTYAGYTWILNVTTSVGEQPDISPSWQHYFGPLTVDTFDASNAYDTGELAIGSDTNVYLSLINNNNVQPVGAAAGKWAALAGTTAAAIVLWPAGVGPSHDPATSNIYRLPSGWLRPAPTDPKAGINSYLGITFGGPRNDWVYEGNFFISSDPGPVLQRFVADVWDVTMMDPMFCEGLAANIALSVCEILTQSTDKLKTIREEYMRIMGEARLLDLIERGATFPPLDSYISARL